MSEEGFESTKIEKPKGADQQSEVDALIAGALAELETPKGKEEKPERVMSATPISIPAPPPPKKEEPKVEPKLEVKEKPQAAPKKAEPKSDDEAYEETLRKFNVGALIKGKISHVDPSGILVDIGYKSDGFIPAEEIPEGVKVGDEIEAVIEKLETKEGYVQLSRSHAEEEIKWKRSYELMKSRALIEAKVKTAVKGGLVVEFNGLRGFIPASQVMKSAEEKLEDFVNKTIPAKVIEVNRRQGKIVLSHRLGQLDAQKQESMKIIDEIETGQVRKGRVTNIKNFGAFVDLGGIEGLIHLSELSWKRVRHPNDVLKVGQELDVFVLSVDKVNKKVSLGLKELQNDPWANVTERYKPGQIVKAKVLRLAKFGAFVEIEEGLEGLVHISELSNQKIATPDQAVKPGEVHDFKILRIVPEEQRIGLSLKAVALEKEKKHVEEKVAEENKVTIADLMAEKERQRAEKEEEIEEEEEEVEEEEQQAEEQAPGENELPQ